MAHTPGYRGWRSTIAHIDEYLDRVIPTLSTPELLAAYNDVLVGVARERLDLQRSCGDFHFAAGMILGELRKRGLKP